MSNYSIYISYISLIISKFSFVCSVVCCQTMQLYYVYIVHRFGGGYNVTTPMEHMPCLHQFKCEALTGIHWLGLWVEWNLPENSFYYPKWYSCVNLIP